MNWRRLLALGLVVVVIGGLAWVLFVTIPRRYRTAGPARPAAPAAPAAAAIRRIKAHLFYVGESGDRLTSAERDVPFAADTVGQARQIVEAQIAPVEAPALSAIPAGTKLRAIFVTDRGEAYVDLTGEVASAHTGGATDELLTVYTIVNALAANLPAVASVQILVDGKEVETLAGHVDLRRPLAKNMEWVQ